MATPNERADQMIREAKIKFQQAKEKAARIKAQAAAKTAKAERAKDTRRKILAGSVALSRIDRAQFVAILDSALTRADDRALFDLPPLVPLDEPGRQ